MAASGSWLAESCLLPGHHVGTLRSVVKLASGMSDQGTTAPSQLIDERIEELGDWRGKTLSQLRALIKQADPEVVEEWKWVKPSSGGTAVWSHDGGICTGEVYKDKVKLTFFKGASLDDPSGLFNSSLEGNVRRAIDVHEGESPTRTRSRRSFAPPLP